MLLGFAPQGPWAAQLQAAAATCCAPFMKVAMQMSHSDTGSADDMSGHMLSNMAFLKTMTLKTVNQTVSTDGDLAWVTTETHRTGIFNDREIDETTKEFLIIRKGDTGWQVTHIHWGK